MANFNDISKAIQKALKQFGKSIPGLQSDLYKEILNEVKRLDTDGKKIKVTVKNLSILASIKNKLNRIILNKDYISEVKEFAKVFNEVYNLQNSYWKSVESNFKPRPLLKAIRNQAITDAVKSLTQSGISANVSDNIIGILRTNITAGGSYADLAAQLRESLMNTETKGVLDRYTKQITIDSVNQFSRQYTNIVASDLGYSFFRYMNSEIDTSRPFCQAMVENNSWFHVSQIPEMLEAKYLGKTMTYTDNFGEGVKEVKLNSKTNLPAGFIQGTNADNFFIRAGGWNCQHSIQPVNERQVPNDIKEKIYATAAYQRWNGEDVKEEVKQTPKETEEKNTELKVNKTPELLKPLPPKSKGGVDMEALMDDRESFGNLLRQNKEVYKEIQKDFPELDIEEILSISMYGNTTYKQLNRFLRNPETEADFRPEYYENFGKLLNQGLDKLKNYEGTVYRGADVDGITMEKYINAFKSGKPITDKGFVSTSRELGYSFADKNTTFFIKSKTGKSIEKIIGEDDISEAAKEKEVLFKSGRQFKITNIKTQKINGKGKTSIWMEEL